jgi:hypothetical protein
VLLGNGNGSFQAGKAYNTGGGFIEMAAGDFNGDGYPDLAAVGGLGATIFLNAADWGTAGPVPTGDARRTSVRLAADPRPPTVALLPPFGVLAGVSQFPADSTAEALRAEGPPPGQATAISEPSAGSPTSTAAVPMLSFSHVVDAVLAERSDALADVLGQPDGFGFVEMVGIVRKLGCNG